MRLSCALIIIFLCISFQILGSNQIRVMTYNLMYYGAPYTSEPSPFCDEINNNVAKKNQKLQLIIDYALPDIIGFNEIRSDSSNIKLLLDSVLNTNGRQNYKTATFDASFFQARKSYYWLLNPIFYNSSKLTLHKFESISTGTSREALIYTFYVNSSVNNPSTDTVFITCIQAHLKASNTTADETERGKESQLIMQKIESSNLKGNVLVMGDFNSYKSTDKGIYNFTNWPNANYKFFDPLNNPGVWSVNEQFKNVHSQSTHFYSTGCFSGGGLDDRFDFILIQRSLIEGAKSLTYIDGSYTTIGQDGKHFNDAINYLGNTSVPPSIANALYEISDHLPVFLNIDVAIPLHISRFKNNTIDINTKANSSISIVSQLASSCIEVFIIDISGKVVQNKVFNKIRAGQSMNFDFSSNGKGVYFIKVIDHQSNFIATKKFIR